MIRTSLFPVLIPGQRARWLVLIAWLISFILSIPIAVLFHVRPVQGSSQCWIEFEQPWQWQLYMSLVALALFVIPALIISICYILIITTIWAKSKLYSKYYQLSTSQVVSPLYRRIFHYRYLQLSQRGQTSGKTKCNAGSIFPLNFEGIALPKII